MSIDYLWFQKPTNAVCKTVIQDDSSSTKLFYSNFLCYGVAMVLGALCSLLLSSNCHLICEDIQ